MVGADRSPRIPAVECPLLPLCYGEQTPYKKGPLGFLPEMTKSTNLIFYLGIHLPLKIVTTLTFLLLANLSLDIFEIRLCVSILTIPMYADAKGSY